MVSLLQVTACAEGPLNQDLLDCSDLQHKPAMKGYVRLAGA